MDFDTEIVRRVKQGAIRIPPYPAVAMRLSQLLREPSRNRAEVVGVVRADAALAASVLRVANSAVYAGVDAITTLDLAVGRIGEAELTRLALASSLAADAGKAGPLGRIRRHIWHDSITAAVCCEAVAPELGLDAGELFVAGLLHDVGRMVTLNAVEDLLQEHPAEPSRRAYEWWALVERFHVELGLVLAATWKLPQLFSDCISQHHCAVPAGDFRAQAAAVAAVDRVVEQLGLGTAMTPAALQSIFLFDDPSAYDRVAAALPALADLIATFEHGPVRESPSKVAAEPPAAPTPPVLPFKLKLKGKGEVACRSASAAAVSFGSPNALPENFLQELTVDANRETFSLWVKVVRCERTPHGGGFEVEGRPFALGGKELARWQALANGRSLAA